MPYLNSNLLKSCCSLPQSIANSFMSAFWSTLHQINSWWIVKSSRTQFFLIEYPASPINKVTLQMSNGSWMSFHVDLKLFLNCALFLFTPAGGSYKKIGYYDMTKGNLSWYGNDRWIGKDAFVSLISHIWSCLSLSVTFSSALNPLARNHSLHYSRRAPPHLSYRHGLASQAPPSPEKPKRMRQAATVR